MSSKALDLIKRTSKRKNIRFKPEKSTMVMVKQADHQIHGLVLSESHGGLSAVFCFPCPFKISLIVEAALGEFDFARYEVVWISKIDEELIKVGLKHLK